MRKVLTEEKETTGAKVSVIPSIRSPLKQILAFRRLISPEGDLLIRKTQVAGTIQFPAAWARDTSVQTP